MEFKWKSYLNKFENEIMLPIYTKRVYDIKAEPVPLRSGKLHNTPFAIFIGEYFKSNRILSFNYYGLFKPSNELVRSAPPDSSIVLAPVIHFSSIKIEHIEKYNRELLLDFVAFKKFLVKLRWHK